MLNKALNNHIKNIVKTNQKLHQPTQVPQAGKVHNKTSHQNAIHVSKTVKTIHSINTYKP